MLKPPSWSPTAKPTTKGWIDPITGELLVSRRLSERQVTEYYLSKEIEPVDVSSIQEPAPIIEADPVYEESSHTAEPLIEADPVVMDTSDYLSEESSFENIHNMTKAELVEYVRERYGVTLDGRKTKKLLIEEILTL